MAMEWTALPWGRFLVVAEALKELVPWRSG